MFLQYTDIFNWTGENTRAPNATGANVFFLTGVSVHRFPLS